MRRQLRTFIVGALIVGLSINSAAACRHFYGHAGHRAYAPVYYGPVAYGGPCGPPAVAPYGYFGGCGPYVGCGPCAGIVVEGAPAERIQRDRIERVPAPAPPAEPAPPPVPRPLPPPRQPATVDRPLEPELPPSLPPEPLEPPMPETFLPEPPPPPEPVPPVEPEDDIFGRPAEMPDDIFEAPEDVQPPPPPQPPAEEPDDIFDAFPAEPPAPPEPEQPAEPIDEPADEPFDFFDVPAEEPADEMPLEDEMPAEEEPVDDFDDPFGNVLREPGGLASDAMRTWTDDTGNYSCRGRLIHFLDGDVRLLKDNGRTTTVPLSRLSAGDLEFVHRQARAHQAEAYQTAHTAPPRLAN